MLNRSRALLHQNLELVRALPSAFDVRMDVRFKYRPSFVAARDSYAPPPSIDTSPGAQDALEDVA